MTPMDPATATDDDPKPNEPSVSEISTANLDTAKARDPEVQAPGTGPGEKPPGFDTETPVVAKSLFNDAVHHDIGTGTGANTPVGSVISSGLSGLVDARLATIELQNKELRESVARMQQLL